MTRTLDLPWMPPADVLEQYRQVLAGWPVPHTELRLPTRAGETFVVACGDEQAPPLVLLHGAQANAATWMFDAALWSRHFRVYAIDLVGEPGFSAPDRPARADGYARWLDDVLDGLGVERAAFAAISYGGWVAMEYAVRRPDRVTRLALLCPAGIGRHRRFMWKALPLLLLGRWGKARLRQMIMGPPPENVPAAARPLMALIDRVIETTRPRTDPIPVVADSALASLRIPLLAIVGGKDPLLDSRDTARRLARCVPQAQVCFLPDGHHFLPGQQQRIERFLLEDAFDATAPSR